MSNNTEKDISIAPKGKYTEWARSIESCRHTLTEIAREVGDEALYQIIGQTGGSVRDLLTELQRACEQAEANGN